jgi:hypothetical protein
MIYTIWPFFLIDSLQFGLCNSCEFGFYNAADYCVVGVCRMVYIENGLEFACKVFVEIFVRRKTLAVCKSKIVMLYFV